jgi:quercetin dioxygenase-like cupin family protein
MLASLLLMASTAAIPAPLVPGGCTALAADHPNEAGCYLLAEMNADNPPPQLYWHIVEFTNLADTEAEARKHRWSKAVSAHDRFWLYVMSARNEPIGSGTSKAIIGPMAVPSGSAVTIRFLTSKFPPGMRTRVHSHPGSEAFYVIEGEQCVETPTTRHRFTAGRSYIVQGGLHVQAAAKGRKSLVALILRPNATWSQPDSSWTPSKYCER